MWLYECTNPEPSKHEIELGRQACGGSVDKLYAVGREILYYDSDNWEMLRKIKRCGQPHPCRIKYCSKCHKTPLDRDAWRVDRRAFIAEDVVNPVRYTGKKKPGTARHIQNAISALSPFYGVPIDELAPITLKYCVLQGGEDYVAVKQFYADQMRFLITTIRKCIHPDAKMYHRFEWSWTVAGEVKHDLPMRAPGVFDAKDMVPDQVVALLHSHGFAHVPGFTWKETGALLREMFTGRWQVHVSKPIPDTVAASSYDIRQNAAALPPSLSIDPYGEYLQGTPDLPDDALCQDEPYWEDQRCHRDRLIDQYLDASDPDPDGEYDFWASGYGAMFEGMSGAVGYASYMGKQHPPKPRSRYEAAAKASYVNSGNHDDFHQLSPKQMLIAFHGDAEIERAFSNKNRAHSVGVRKSTNKSNRPKVVDQSDSDDKRTCCINFVCNDASDNYQYDYGMIDVTNFIDIMSDASALGVIDKEFFDSRSYELIYGKVPHWLSHDHNTHIIKENCDPSPERSLFLWPGSHAMSSLCLGCRMLHPP